MVGELYTQQAGEGNDARNAIAIISQGADGRK
jgi:hypothetical protein